MSEKRIYCIEVSGECKYLLDVNRPALAHLCESTQGLYCTKNFSWKPIVKETCKVCSAAEYLGITREQAIEKMAKAIYEAMCPNLSQMFAGGWHACTKIAEAVLEDILEGHNDKR
jgi:hypothetical protein